MPTVVAGAVLAGVVAGSSVAAGIGFSIFAFAGSLVLGGLSYALTPKPKKGSVVGSTEGNTVALRQSDIVRKHVYGHTRIVSGYAHMMSTGVNGKLHIFVLLCEGRLRSINEIIVNDYVIPPDWIDDEGNVTQGRYAGKLIIRKHLGSATQTADSLAISNIPEWTTDHRLQGIGYFYAILTKDQDVYPTGLPNFSAIVEGGLLYDPRVNDEVWTTNVGIFSADYLINREYGYEVDNDNIDYTNISAQANICDEIVDIEPVSKNVASIDTATDIITLQGDILEFQFGDRVQVSSTGSMPTGLSVDTDYYVIPYQVNTTPRILLATSLDNSMAKIAIDIETEGSSVVVTKTGEPRYHGSGIIETDVDLAENLNNIANSMAGRATQIAGFWTLLAGAWRTPDITYGISDLRGQGISFKTDLSMSESYNIVKGLFISPQNNYQPSDYPPARYQTFVDQDNGIEAAKEINLPFTTRPTTAQRIAKIELFRGRQGIIFTSDFTMKGLQNQPGDNVLFDLERLGWEEKPFEITEFTFDVADGSLVTRMTLRETAQEIFDWTSGEAITYDPAPNTTLPNPFFVQNVTGLAYNSRKVETRDGDEIFTLILKWNQHPDQFVTNFGFIEISFKESAETEWRPSFSVDGMQTQTDVVNASLNTLYDLRVRARNNLGVRSLWTTILEATVGYSGGITESIDYGSVADVAASDDLYDYGSVEDAVESDNFYDWGYVI